MGIWAENFLVALDLFEANGIYLQQELLVMLSGRVGLKVQIVMDLLLKARLAFEA